MFLIFFIFQWGIGLLKKEHIVFYSIYANNITFEVEETYQKDKIDTYDILIKYGDNHYSYLLTNNFHKQKKIITKIEYYQDNDYQCIYPVLENQQGTYLQCRLNGNLYTETSFPDQDYIQKVKNDLQEKGYFFTQNSIKDNSITMGNSVVYKGNLLENDIITLWNYKGIDIIDSSKFETRNVLSFDKYENNQGYLVGKYYIIPNYSNSRVLEFSSIILVDIETNKMDTLELGYTLSKDTYINGIVHQKLYLTDPTNLLQIEIYPNKRVSRLIGSKDLGGQIFRGNWENINIYNLAKEYIAFHDTISEEITAKYVYTQLLEERMYYYIIKNNEVYRVSKSHLDIPVFLFNSNGLSNIKVVDNTVYFVSDNTLFYYQEGIGIIPILKNNELRYNTENRIDVYRKS